MTDKSKFDDLAIVEYRRVLAEKKPFPGGFFAPKYRNKRLHLILEYALEELLGFKTPQEALEGVTYEKLCDVGLKFVLQYVPRPIELTEDDVRYVVWFVYPETKTVTEEDLIIEVFHKVHRRERRKYPKGYFEGVDGKKRGIFCFKYLCEHELGLKTDDEFLNAFGSHHGMSILGEYGLTTLVTAQYTSCQKLLSVAYPHLADRALKSS